MKLRPLYCCCCCWLVLSFAAWGARLAAQEVPAKEVPAKEAVALSLDGSGTIELRASWEPLAESVYGFGDKYPLVRDLKPAAERASYKTAAFRPFLPQGPVRLGEIWRVDPEAALPFLKQLHPGATTRLHHGWFGDRQVEGIAAPGAWAILRAVGPRQAEIVLRVHAEFLLAGDGSRTTSSWMTPAQFQGRLLIDREKSSVARFELLLPDRSANVDFNIAIAGTRGVAADIGRIPRMELRSVSPAAEDVGYTVEIGLDAAQRALERAIYPYGVIDWLPLGEALAAAKATGKPMHVVALFGALLDESC